MHHRVLHARALVTGMAALALVLLAACGNSGSDGAAGGGARGDTKSGTHVAAASGARIVYPSPSALAAGSQASPDTIKPRGGTPTIAYLPMGTEFNYHKALFEGISRFRGPRASCCRRTRGATRPDSWACCRTSPPGPTSTRSS